jgi:predicted small secreted protein
MHALEAFFLVVERCTSARTQHPSSTALRPVKAAVLSAGLHVDTLAAGATKECGMKTTMRFGLLLVLLLGSFAMTGCNTVEGAGKDIEAAGEEVQDAAD